MIEEMNLKGKLWQKKNINLETELLQKKKKSMLKDPCQGFNYS